MIWFWQQLLILLTTIPKVFVQRLKIEEAPGMADRVDLCCWALQEKVTTAVHREELSLGEVKSQLAYKDSFGFG